VSGLLGLFGVQFDDELFLDRQTDVFALGKIANRSVELLGIELEPRRDAATGGTARLRSCTGGCA